MMQFNNLDYLQKNIHQMKYGLFKLKDIIFRAKTVFNATIHNFLNIFSAGTMYSIIVNTGKNTINKLSIYYFNPVSGEKRHQLFCL